VKHARKGSILTIRGKVDVRVVRRVCIVTSDRHKIVRDVL
jgi:hypothetical protein